MRVLVERDIWQTCFVYYGKLEIFLHPRRRGEEILSPYSSVENDVFFPVLVHFKIVVVVVVVLLLLLLSLSYTCDDSWSSY